MSDESNPQMAQALLDAMEMMAPIIDAADGLRANMEMRGWSPTAAESVALTWLNATISNAYGRPS